MSRRFIASAALALVLPLSSAPAQSDSLAARVDSIARRVLAATGEPGASVAVVQHGRVAYVQAYGKASLEPPVAATPDMRYAIGSVSKQFTAAAILLLQQEGKLSLDDKVQRWVPGLTRGREVTIRHLLSHTSGYQDFWPQDYVPPEMQKPISAQAILDRWARRPLDFDPGARWQYSNTNFVIAALVVEKASGMPFYRFVQTRLLDPAGLTSARDFDSDSRAVGPTGYMRYALGPLHPALATGPGWMYGAGELAMTARDLAKWDLAMIGKKVLRPSSWKTLETVVLRNDGVSTGYGLGVYAGLMNGHRVVTHSGEVAGFTAQNFVFPDDSAAVVVLVNQDAASSTGMIARQVAASLFSNEDAKTATYTARARRILEDLQKGTIDRSLFTANANSYFSDQALRDFAESLAPLGTPTSFVQVHEESRGGMIERSYQVVFPKRTLSLWTYELPDGTLEQLQVAPAG